uniref:NADH-ubiquinone oxidoreductase chain 4 n=1 Tax=Nilaparvata bakeri TaxID=1223488 RepID=A0A1L1VMM4_9HEMI|nr:NADH dehydrogenase subunit 4 [Nilaparvata bakeri]AGE94103.1 NADH dehydrogenase subunit 4 [Nilaparvata bakeri]
MMLSLIISIFFLTLISFKINFYTMIYIFFILFMGFMSKYEFYDFFSFISFSLGMDKYSYFLMYMTFWLFILSLYSLLNLKGLYFSYLKFIMLMMVLLLFLCFLSLSFFNFYFYFECSVIPIFLVIYGWGYQPERVFSGLYFFFYTLFSSLPLLLLILGLNSLFGYFYFGMYLDLSNLYYFFFFIFSFLVKLPLFFFHLWLPSAHVEAPSSGSMILAGVMLKLGGYGLIRVLYLFKDLVCIYSYFFISVSILGSLYVSFFCLLQSDLSVLVAYSSVSHMGLVISGIFTFSYYGYMGSLCLMISHGLVSSGLFYFVGCLFDRFSSRSLFLMSGMINYCPSLMMFFFFLIVSNMSCPPSLNLISEVFICFSLLTWHWMTLVYIFFLLFFSACAMICLFSFMCHGGYSYLFMNMDSGLVREFYVISMHIFPVYMFIFSLNYFI